MTINSKQAIFRINEGIWKNMNLWKLYEKAQTLTLGKKNYLALPQDKSKSFQLAI